jgi:hypothetical protein
MPREFALPREVQSLAAGVGSAFDFLVKTELVEKFHEKKGLVKKLFGQVDKENKDFHEAWEGGRKSMANYKSSGVFAFMKNGFTDVEKNIYGSVRGVPLYGMLDAEYKGVPFDWKVSGYTSKSGVSPKPRFYRIWDNGMPKPAHKKYEGADMPWEDIDEKWATQLCTYGWLIGKKIGEPFEAYIDMLCWGKERQKMRVAQYRGLITEEFQIEVRNKYVQIWKEINDGSFVQRLASDKIYALIESEAINENWF